MAQRLPEAELQLLRAQADAPHDLRVLKLLALVRFKLGRLAEARQIYREAAQIAPEDAAIRLNLGLIALKLDWFDEAVTELETTVRLHPDDRRAWSYLGNACARTGARGQAAAAFRRAGQHELAAEMERGRARLRQRRKWKERPPPSPTARVPSTWARHAQAGAACAGTRAIMSAQPAPASGAARSFHSPPLPWLAC